MRGRSPFNKPDVRKREVFSLLSGLGGRSRWRDLEVGARKSQMGPTTLKRTLDDMEEEGTIYREARLGPKGPEAWYILQLTKDEVWQRLQEKPIGKRVAETHGALSRAQGDDARQREILSRELPSLISAYQMMHLYALQRAVREENIEDVLRLYGYIYTTFLIDEAAAILGLCLNWPEVAHIALEHTQTLLEDALHPITFPEEAEPREPT